MSLLRHDKIAEGHIIIEDTLQKFF